MPLSKKDMRLILRGSIEVQQSLVNLLDGFEKVALNARPNEPVENLHIQELWVLRNALLHSVNQWPLARPLILDQIAKLQAVADNL